MPAKKHCVILNEEERLALERAARSNKRSLRERQRARILLAAADGQDDASIAKAVGVHPNTAANVRRRFAAGGTRTVRRAGQNKRKARRLDGRAEAHLAALVCSAPPDDRKRWSLHLLAGKLIKARRSWMASAMRRCARPSKKCPQAVAEEGLVHSAQGECGVCRRHGGRA